ncbi:hypothetical protein PVAP13_4KG351088 [Panicum virgatum]|uniref:Uncharacterized protein n=1 Tax=Panicum virgatum TaxID=38727 RepID=A0A8T0TTF9_PANVG|nr:hypothetical protein PVAP13_4KG351088 [Panicum virgatum]
MNGLPHASPSSSWTKTSVKCGVSNTANRRSSSGQMKMIHMDLDRRKQTHTNTQDQWLFLPIRGSLIAQTWAAAADPHDPIFHPVAVPAANARPAGRHRRKREPATPDYRRTARRTAAAGPALPCPACRRNEERHVRVHADERHEQRSPVTQRTCLRRYYRTPAGWRRTALSPPRALIPGHLMVSLARSAVGNRCRRRRAGLDSVRRQEQEHSGRNSSSPIRRETQQHVLLLD